MPCTQLARFNYNDNTGAYLQLAAVSGEIEIYIFSWGAMTMVTGVTSAAAALTEHTAGRFMELNAVPHRIIVDPSTTWIRGYSTANVVSALRQE